MTTIREALDDVERRASAYANERARSEKIRSEYEEVLARLEAQGIKTRRAEQDYEAATDVYLGLVSAHVKAFA